MGFPLPGKTSGITKLLGLNLKLQPLENVQHFDSDPLKYLIVTITYLF